VPIVIDVSLLGGAKAKPSQGTNVCVLKCFYQEYPID